MSEIVRSAATIAAEINFIKQRTKNQLLSALIEIGGRLCEAKEIVGHGGWEQWLIENVDYSQSTAGNLMRIYKEYSDTQIDLITGVAPCDAFRDLSYSQAVAMFGLPMEEKLEIIQSENFDDMSTRDIKEEASKRREAEKRATELKSELDEKTNALDKAEEAQAKLVEEVEKLRNEISKMQSAPVSDSSPDVGDAQISFDNALKAEREKADAEIEKYKQKADKLSEKLKSQKEKEEELRAAIEADEAKKARAEYESALSEANERAKELEKKLQSAANPAVQKFSMYYENFNGIFEKICDCIEEAESEQKEKLKAGMLKVLEQMKNVLDGIEVS